MKRILVLLIQNLIENHQMKTQVILSMIKERMSLIDRAQQNISGLTENVIDLKNILSNTSTRPFWRNTP